jgi:predicted peptidase
VPEVLAFQRLDFTRILLQCKSFSGRKQPVTVRILIFGLLLATTSRADDMAIKNQTEHLFRGQTSAKSFELKYLLFLPKDYDPSGEKKWPLMLFLHGAGERGTNLAKVAAHGPPKMVKTNANFPFILISPQCPPGQTWADEPLLALLDDIFTKYRVNEKRICLTGLSMGGYGSWSLASRYPQRFAAVAPICGGGETLSLLLPPPGRTTALKKLPIWAFHGAKDEVVPLQESERMVNIFKRVGNENVKLTVYPEAGHDSWTEAYSNQELYDWLLHQER